MYKYISEEFPPSTQKGGSGDFHEPTVTDVVEISTEVLGQRGNPWRPEVRNAKWVTDSTSTFFTGDLPLRGEFLMEDFVG